MNSSSFDYIALAQEYIDIEKEYRAVFLDGNYQFAYEKIIDNAKFCDNLSPLHREGSRAEFVINKKEIEAIKNLCKPMFQKNMIPFCGIDIAKSKKGEYIVIEANSSPGFDHIIKHEGESEIVKLYENILKKLSRLEF